MQRLLAAEFDRQSWEYDLSIGRKLVEELERGGEFDAQKIADRLPGTFFERNRTSRADVAASLERVVAGRTLRREAGWATVVIMDNRYQVHVGSGARITNSKFNIGEGTQINVDIDTSKEDVLAAVEAILRAGLAGSWNREAARDLATLVDRRDDIDVADVQRLTRDVAEAERPTRGRVEELLLQIAAGGLGGALGTGISSGLGEAISPLPL